MEKDSFLVRSLNGHHFKRIVFPLRIGHEPSCRPCRRILPHIHALIRAHNNMGVIGSQNAERDYFKGKVAGQRIFSIAQPLPGLVAHSAVKDPRPPLAAAGR